MAQQVDLNELRRTMLDNQRRGEVVPTSTARKISVDRDGKIILGDTEGRITSEVQQGVWAATLERDRQIVAHKLPSNTQELSIGGVTGWGYRIVSELGDPYMLFAYNDGSLYQVLVVAPDLVGLCNPHDVHLFNDGRICFGDTGGLPTLEQAYAKSVVWATGFSVFARTGQFPFSTNNL